MLRNYNTITNETDINDSSIIDLILINITNTLN